MIQGLAVLLLRRVVRPSDEFLTGYQAFGLFRLAGKVFRPDLFAAPERRAAALGAHDGRAFRLALVSYRLPSTGEVVPMPRIVPSRPTRNGCCP